MKLLMDIDIENDIKFSKVRKTATKTCIVDIQEDLYQTEWLEIISDIENNSICLDAIKMKEVLEKIDNKIVSYSSSVFDFALDEIKNMYKPIFKSSHYVILNMNTKTVLFHGDVVYEKDDIKNILKIGDKIRCIISFKKISFKDYELCTILELHQIELI